MKIQAFRIQFGTTPQRLILIDLLEQELQAIAANGWPFRAYAFGGLVNKGSPAPKDLDLLLSISHPAGVRWSPLDRSGKLDISPWVRGPTFDMSNPASVHILPPVLSLDEMVDRFNDEPNNVAHGILIKASNCVEIEL